MIAGMILGLALMATAPAEGSAPPGEALPPGAPSDPYELTAWCYGALGEYLTIYEQVIPDLQAIDRQFGTSVVEDRPYSADVAAAREAVIRFGKAMEAAEKASARPIAERGAQSIQRGRGIWARAETQPRRQLARAWLYWGVPDACDATAQALYQRSILAAPALAYNTQAAPAAAPAPAAPAPEATSEIRMPATAPGVFAPTIGSSGSTPLSAQIAATMPRPAPPPPAPPPTVVASAARPSRIIENVGEGAPPQAAPTVPVSTNALPQIAPPAPPPRPAQAAPAPAASAPITTAVRTAPAPAAPAPAPPAPPPIVQAPIPLGPVSSDEPMEPLM
ncbi:MAG: hypothetical protein U1E50_17240 [Caulobacteraceae bacterium]